MKYELEVITNITDLVKGEPKVIFKNHKIKMLFDLDKIDLQEFVDSRTGKHIAKYSLILEEGNSFKINKPYEELKALVINQTIPVLGFAAKSKKYKKC